MLMLENGTMNQTYIVKHLHVEEELKRHLIHLGIQKQAKIRLISLNKESGIVVVATSRLALDRTIIRLIEVEEVGEEENWTPLSKMKVNEKGKVLAIHGTGAIKRRLMDMGITRGTTLSVRKTAPLGDPIQISIRGYELTLRKSEGELVLVSLMEEEESESTN